MSEDNKAEKMDRDDPGYRKWLAERSCSEYMHHTRSGTIQSTRNSEKVRYMFSKKIKLLLCDCEMAVYIVTEDGEVYYWYKVAGSDPIVIYYYSQLIDLRDARFVQTATGRSTFLALTENNTLYYFRIMDNNGLFGWMREIDIRGQITCISCGEAFFVAVTNDYNEVYSWGKNNYGQLGISTCTEEFIEKPCKIKFSGIIVRVACGFTHTLALTAMGEVFVWGGNVYGELGLNHRENVSSPVKIETFGIKKELNVYTKKALDVAAMENLSTVMCEDGLTYVWGICFEQEIRKPVACEYTTLFDACNALCARPPTTVKMSTGKEKSGILEELANAFNDPFMSNLTIEVYGRSIYVDKSVLQIRSSYFRTMSSKLFDEKQSTLKLSQFSYVTYYAYFKYLYTGRIELSLEEKFELLKLADMFKETQLEEFILRTIKKEVTVANVIPVYNMAKKFNKQVLEEYCLKFFAENPKDVIGSDKFVELDEDTKEIFWAKVPEDFV